MTDPNRPIHEDSSGGAGISTLFTSSGACWRLKENLSAYTHHGREKSAWRRWPPNRCPGSRDAGSPSTCRGDWTWTANGVEAAHNGMKIRSLRVGEPAAAQIINKNTARRNWSASLADSKALSRHRTSGSVKGMASFTGGKDHLLCSFQALIRGDESLAVKTGSWNLKAAKVMALRQETAERR